MQYTWLKILMMLVLLSPQNQAYNGPQAQVPEPPSAEDVWIEEVTENMTLPDKIGQMIITGIDGKTLDDDEYLMIRSGQVGGVIFLGHNVKSKDQFTSLVESLPKGVDIPLFKAIDQEGGRVQRLPLNRSEFPSAIEIGQTPENAYDYGRKLGDAVSGFDLNLNLAPVLDVFSNPYNKVIGNRAFGRTPEVVSEVGIDVMKGIQAEGVIPCLKHFPGHGDTLVDSHVGLPVVEHDIERLNDFEWVPFKDAIDQGADMIMTAHVLIPAIDEVYPATLSERIIEDHLRGTLGFDGVVITDDLVMGAISKQYQYEFAVRRAVDAGVDIMLISNNDYVDEIQHALYTAVQNGELDEARIDASLERILRLKYKYIVSGDEIINVVESETEIETEIETKIEINSEAVPPTDKSENVE